MSKLNKGKLSTTVGIVRNKHPDVSSSEVNDIRLIGPFPSDDFEREDRKIRYYYDGHPKG